MTNQNDTQDEAERLAHEEAVRVSKLQGGKTQDGSNQCPECYLKGHTEGYRAGVAARDELVRMQMAGISTALCCNTAKSMADQLIDKTNPYWTPAYGDAVDSIKREISLQEELNQSKRETQAAVHLCEQSRAEVERLKLRNDYLEERISDEHSDLRFVQEQLAAEKAKADEIKIGSCELLAAIFRVKDHSQKAVIDKADQLGKILGYKIEFYSTDSGDGSGK